MGSPEIDYVIASSIPPGIAVEASIPYKPGNVSPVSEYSDLKHWGFIASVSPMAIELYRFLSGIEGYRPGAVGEAIYRLFKASLDMQPYGNVNLGFIILSTPIALSTKLLFGSSDQDTSPRRDPISLDTIKSIVENARELMLSSSDYASVEWIKKAIRLASPSYLSIYVGRGEDVFARGTRSSIGEFISVFKDHDLILLEIYRGYSVTLSLFLRLIELGRDLSYDFLRDLYIDLGSRYVDTNIARKKGIKYALSVLREFRVLRTIADRRLRRLYLEHLDRSLKSVGANPGSIADILANAVSLYLLYTNLSRAYA